MNTVTHAAPRSMWNAANYMALKPTRITANVPAELKDLIERRIKTEKYPSVSAYIVGLILFDLYCRRPHLMTGPLMRQPQFVRDEVIEQLVKDFEEGNRPGGWFEHRVQELIDRRIGRPE